MSTSEIFLNYTDIHDVDEDETSIIIQGGSWPYESRTGAAHREMSETPTSVWDTVASKNNHTLSLLRKSV